MLLILDLNYLKNNPTTIIIIIIYLMHGFADA
jgi:hypothetical protein